MMPALGVIEGFYGRPWDDDTRLEMMNWLARLQFDAYLYAPKADAALRKAWRSDWPADRRSHLQAVGRACEAQGIAFTVGLSPFALYAERYDVKAQRELHAKVRSIEDLGASSLALLFDDMPGDTPDLAQRQAAIANDLADVFPDIGLRICPSYYSDDPVLDRVFGERPDGYLDDLGRDLAPGIGVFWTGPQVCSPAIVPDDLAPVRERMGRRLSLWDNYPVNDSKLRSEHLYLAPLTLREAAPGAQLDSHWLNAMNQPALSLPALASLPRLYGRADAVEEAAVLAAAGVSPAVCEACLPLAHEARSTLPGALQTVLENVARGEGAGARELAAWLAGEYIFDPNCLTD